MSTTKLFAGVSYNLPNNREPKGAWGADTATFLQAVADKSLTTAGGSAALTSDINFGTSFGIIGPYFKSSSGNIATTGVIRFGNNEGLAWRNAANSADIVLKVDGTNALTFNGNTLPSTANKLSAFAATTSAELAGVITDETGTGALVFATSPTFVTPVLGAATATSINKITFTSPATGATLTVADGKTVTQNNTLTFSGTDGSSIAFGTGGTVVYTSNKLSVHAATTSAELAGIISDETGTGSLVFGTGPTLDNPTIDNAVTLLHKASVTTPSSGRVKVYPKSDNKLYILDSTGAETAVGTGSGSGIVNYISEPDAESAILTWATYNDGASATPVDGTGGVPSVTWTRNTTTPLRGNADFKFSKPASNCQGQGVAIPFTISIVDRSRRLQITCDLNSTATNYASADLTFYIYDVTNSVLITPLTTSVDKKTGSLVINFDTSATGTSYRFIIHVATVNALAYDVYFDTFSVGPGTAQQAYMGSSWQNAVTLTATGSSSNPTKGTSTETAYWRQDGPDMILEYYYNQTAAGAAGSGSYRWSIPNNLSLDTSKVTLGQTILGDGYAYNGTSEYSGLVVAGPSNTVSLQIFLTANSVSTAGSTNVSFANATAVIRFLARIPILEWANAASVSAISQNTSSPLKAGIVQAFAGSTTPGGWLDCDGSTYSQTAYPQLYAALGTTWSTCTNPLTGSAYAAPSAGTFRVPDLRGAFLRGAGTANAAGVTTSLAGYQADTTAKNGLANSTSSISGTSGGASVAMSATNLNQINRAFSTFAAAGYNSGDQAYDIQSHTHSIAGTAAAQTITGDVETRPDNIGVKFIIKAWDDSFNLAGFANASSSANGFVAPRKGQTALTVTSTAAGWTTIRAIGIYYQDQDGNHRLKFNIYGTITSKTLVSDNLLISGITAKNIASWIQPVSGWNVGGSRWTAAAISPNTGTISLDANSTSVTAIGASGDIELESKPTWA